ncbi:uncharacterized protein LOC124495486 [Dermatophagoides farinae]|uniref:uncharacterized protein LOC124495486 n=1 Tax=Dermatophagoides farinae TaxID=6954 RepID=UPI003F614BAC
MKTKQLICMLVITGLLVSIFLVSTADADKMLLKALKLKKLFLLKWLLLKDKLPEFELVFKKKPTICLDCYHYVNEPKHHYYPPPPSYPRY